MTAPVPLFRDGFECGDFVRWGGVVGGSMPVLPPTGVFRPRVQCSWTGPGAGDPFPFHANVLATPLVADLPAGLPGSVEVVVVTYNFTDGGSESCVGSNPAYFGVLRIIDGVTCAHIANVWDPAERLIAAATPAIGDLDGDGRPEIVALRSGGGPIAFRWNTGLGRYETWWTAPDTDLATRCRWDGPVLHDLDDDGFPEVLSSTEVFDGRTGVRRDDGTVLPAQNMSFAALGDVDADGSPELVGSQLWGWNAGDGVWEVDGPVAGAEGFTAYADFGTAGGTFDPAVRDGVAEVVRSAGDVRLQTLAGATVFSVPGAGNGAPAIADFDGDGQPEVAVSSGTAVKVLDLDCGAASAGCAGGYVRWSQPVQDFASGRSMSSAFDFDRDGRDEVVFADECFARVFDGLSGDVLASIPRRSCTWVEGMPVADTDGDGSAEVLVGSNANCGIACPAVDPIQRGLRGVTGADCLSGTVDVGYCRCSTGADCPTGHSCAAPPAGTPGSGNTCRAAHPGALFGLQIVEDELQRWGRTAPIWNQHTFSVTNVSTDGVVPSTANWIPNFLVPSRNDFRAADSVCSRP